MEFSYKYLFDGEIAKTIKCECELNFMETKIYIRNEMYK